METAAQSIMERVSALIARKPRVIIALDGRCAAGKTTLASLLERLCRARNIECFAAHMDDFFLPPEPRARRILSQDGTVSDLERLRREVLRPLSRGENFFYKPYDCRENEFQAPKAVRARSVAIIEGAYSCHPALRDYYDLRVFLTVPPSVQRARIERRNGAQALKTFTGVGYRWRSAISPALTFPLAATP